MQDQAVAHAARIAGKRLRYVLEPVAAAVEGGTALIKRLRLLQEVIGEMHDVHVVAEDVIQAAEDAGADQARRVATALLEGETADDAVRAERSRDPRPGLLAIAAHLRARGQSAFRELEQQWLGEHAGELPAAGRQIADRLTGSPGADASTLDLWTAVDARADEALRARHTSGSTAEEARQLLAVAASDDEVETAAVAHAGSSEYRPARNGEHRNGFKGSHTVEPNGDTSAANESRPDQSGAASPSTEEESSSG